MKLNESRLAHFLLQYTVLDTKETDRYTVGKIRNTSFTSEFSMEFSFFYENY